MMTKTRAIFLSLLFGFTLTSCDQNTPKNENNNVYIETLIIPPMALINPQKPDLSQSQDGWLYSPEAQEDPYHIGPPPLVVKPPNPLSFAEELAQAALARTMHRVRYDGRYLKIGYPMGDVPPDIGVCTDVVIRAYRELGIDLQKEVHEDIRRHFSQYPSRKRWGLRRPDTNIDHRRVYNLQTFFDRKGESLTVTQNPVNYKPGDLVTWQVTPKMPHIGVVLDLVSRDDPRRHLIAHNIGNGPVIDDMLFDFKITGHFRYHPKKRKRKITENVQRDADQS